MPEAEQELIGGYHTEYSGMKLLLFLMAEFLHMITASFLIVILFLGGWHFWGLTGAGDRRHLGHRHRSHRRADDKNLRRHRVLHAGPLELAPLPLRSTDVAGLESDAAAGPGEPRAVAVLVEYGRDRASTGGRLTLLDRIGWAVTLVGLAGRGLLAPLRPTTSHDACHAVRRRTR